MYNKNIKEIGKNIDITNYLHGNFSWRRAKLEAPVLNENVNIIWRYKRNWNILKT